MGLPDQWEICSRTMFLGGEPSAFAYRGDTMAVGMGFNVILLDAVTGSRTSVFCGHGGEMRSLVFSPDGTLLISVSDDGTAKLWDVQTGGVIESFGDCYASVVSGSISPDGRTIALGTNNGTICLLDVRTGARHSFQMYPDTSGYDSHVSFNLHVSHVSFSPVDSRRLLSSSGRDVKQWDLGGHWIGAHDRGAFRVASVAYSFDGTRFVSCEGGTVRVRDSESCAVVVEFRAPDNENLFLCCFSPDGRFIASAGYYKIFVWDITISGARLVRQLVGHSAPVTFITFASSLISGSQDQSVKFWQSSSLLEDSTAADRMAAPHGSIPIVSAKLFAEDGIVVTSDPSGVVKTWDFMTGKRRASFSTPAEGPQDTHLAGDTLIIVWHTGDGHGGGYQVWDVYESRLVQWIHYLPTFDDIKISGDGSKMFGLVNDGSIFAVSMETGEVVGCVESGVWGAPGFFAYGSKVGIFYSRRRGWDFGGPEVSDFGEFPDRPRLDLVESSSENGIKPRWIEDTVTKGLVFRIPERYTEAGARVEWDGRYLLAWSCSGGVLVVDFDSVWPR